VTEPEADVESDELRRARAALDEAFERARAVGYDPDTPDMQALEQAEQAYSRARGSGPGHRGEGDEAAQDR
jgi:hypothetical protein